MEFCRENNLITQKNRKQKVKQKARIIKKKKEEAFQHAGHSPLTVGQIRLDLAIAT